MRALCTFRPNPIKGWGCNARIFFVLLLLQYFVTVTVVFLARFWGGRRWYVPGPLPRALPLTAFID